MGTDRILDIMQTQVGVSSRAGLKEAREGKPTHPLKVVISIPSGGSKEIKLHLFLVNGRYFLTNFQNDSNIYVRQTKDQRPSFKELVSKVAQKYLGQEVEVEFKGAKIKVKIQNVVIRVGYKTPKETKPTEEVIAIKAGNKTPAIQRAEALDRKFEGLFPMPKPVDTAPAGGGKEVKVQRPQDVPNNGLSDRPEQPRKTPKDWVDTGPNDTTTQGQPKVPTTASKDEIKEIVEDAVKNPNFKGIMLGYIGDYNNDGKIDDADFDAWWADGPADKDGDGIPDDVERYHPWFKNWTNPDVDDSGKFSTGNDYDGDGVDDLTEMREGTNPNDPTDNSATRVTTTTQTVTFDGNVTQLHWYGGASRRAAKITTTHTFDQNGNVTGSSDPVIEGSEDPDLLSFWQLKYKAGGYFSHKLPFSFTTGDEHRLKYSVGWQHWPRGFHQSLGFDDKLVPWRLDGIIDWTWNLNPKHMLLLGIGGKYGNPFSNVYLRLGGKHDLSDYWRALYVDWMIKGYPWRSTNDVMMQQLTGNTTVDETTQVNTTLQSGGQYQQVYTGSKTFPVDNTATSTYANGNDPAVDASLRLMKIFGFGNYGNLVLTLNPMYRSANEFGASHIFHNVTGAGWHNVRLLGNALTYDVGIFHRLSLYDMGSSNSRQNHMFNPYLNLTSPYLGGLQLRSQYWANVPTEQGIDTSHGTSHEVSYPFLPWLRGYVSYRYDQNFGYVASLNPGYKGPDAHMGLIGIRGTWPFSSQQKLKYDVYGGARFIGNGNTGGVGSGNVQWDGATSTMRYGAHAGLRYDQRLYTSTDAADRADDILDPPVTAKVAPATLNPQAKAGIITKLQILDFIKTHVFSRNEIPKSDKRYSPFLAYIRALPPEAFNSFKFNEKGLEGKLLAQAKRFNALDATKRKEIVLKLFSKKVKGLLVPEDCDDQPGQAGLCGTGTDLGISDLFAMQITAQVMTSIAANIEGEVRQIAALALGHEKGYAKADAEGKKAIDTEIAKITYDEAGENVAHYKGVILQGIGMVTKETDRYLRADISAARARIKEAEKLLAALLPKGIDKKVVDGIFAKSSIDLVKLLAITDAGRFKKLADVKDLLEKLRAIEAKLDPLSCTKIVAKALVEIKKAIKKLDRLYNVWGASVAVQAKQAEIIALIDANLTVDVRAKLKELNELVYGKYVSGRGLEGGLLQLLIAYNEIDPATIVQVKYDSGKKPVEIAKMGDLTKHDLWYDVFFEIFQSTNKRNKWARSIFKDRESGLVFSTLLSYQPGFKEWLDDVFNAKQTDYDSAKMGSKIPGLTPETIARMQAAATLGALLKSGKVKLPIPVDNAIKGFVRFNYIRATLAGETPASDNPMDINLFALIYKAEAELKQPLNERQMARLKFLLVNDPDGSMPTAWDKKLRFLYLQHKADPAQLKIEVAKLIEKGTRIPALYRGKYTSFQKLLKKWCHPVRPNGDFGETNRVLKRFLELLKY